MRVTQHHLDTIVKWAKHYGARKVILFGSALETPDDANDIDIACDIQDWEIWGFAAKIEEELRVPIDVVPLIPTNRFIEYIGSKGKILYENS
jgi:predicted nucleotidyltransferase